jgi:hypothetical protein
VADHDVWRWGDPWTVLLPVMGSELLGADLLPCGAVAGDCRPVVEELAWMADGAQWSLPGGARGGVWPEQDSMGVRGAGAGLQGSGRRRNGSAKGGRKMGRCGEIQVWWGAGLVGGGLGADE